MNIIRALTGADQVTIRVIRPSALYIEAKYLDEDGYDVNRLEGDEDKEEAVIFSAYTTVHPWAMMVKSLYALLTNVTVIAAWQGYDSTLKAKLADLEALK